MAALSRSKRVALGTLSAPSASPASSNQRALTAVRPQVVRALLSLHPLFVRRRPDDGLEVVAGVRSFRMAKAVLSAGERVPIIEVDAVTAEFLGHLDQLLSPVLMDDLPSERRSRWAHIPQSVCLALGRNLSDPAAVARFQVPPSRTEVRHPLDEK